MGVAKEIKKIQKVSNDTIRTRLAIVRRELGLAAADEVSLEEYLTIFKK
jgi:hypothetical protein